MSTLTISVAEQFSPAPAGRFLDDGPYPGAAFRDNLLLPAIRTSEKVIVDMEGTELAGSSFLEEAFGGLVRAGFSEEILRKKLELKSPRSSDPIRIWRYIHDAALRCERVH
ncbi:hypothetical protein LPB72_06065 [Hydrogenophaga crassostreae]|uniref:DUF4325 domain-containing protein n=1 Tax=Hydrogenophaga crassostreae TaxID=1763535 RepID=A0A167IK75_9BURK|nr:STAS-like domain-containing protein [Hydrogenophaga crassostreae]AOW14526.1 hypothetical protein LPB072_18485 [Hydrogenophaga crassostreae]OAD43064.1 hypothetical protein LPB72_06065 [Hydrogenophaga crassostreae]